MATYIKSGNQQKVVEWITERQDVNISFSTGNTPLYYSIKYGQPKLCRIFLQAGADPNLKINGHPALLWAIKYNEKRVARYLIEFGADPNYTNVKGVSLLMLAGKMKRLNMVKLLIEHGADPFIQSSRGQNAHDYAYQSGAQEVMGYLDSMNKLITYSDTIHYELDGPYVDWENDSVAVMFYYLKDSTAKRTRIIEKTIDIDQDVTSLKGFVDDPGSYVIYRSYEPSDHTISSSGKIFVAGDVHGKYQALVSLLINNKIIDSAMNWSFGNGNLILAGDVFDRGEHVTETLWLIRKLEFQARRTGGNVFLIIGNHETMALQGDHRYLNPKYLFFNNYFFRPYYDLFNNNSELGRWIRKQHAIIKINDIMILHAGISPEVLELELSIDSLNKIIRGYIDDPDRYYKDTSLLKVVHKYGPLWYRGYSTMKNEREKVDEAFVDKVLDHYQISLLIVGHNEQSDIKSLFKGKALAIDVPFDRPGVKSQGLLIDKGRIFRCFTNGNCEPIR